MIETDRNIALMSEPADWRGLKGKIREIRGKIHSKLYRRRLNFILAIGWMAEIWFEKCGYEKEKVFPYIYTVKHDETSGRYEEEKFDNDNNHDEKKTFVYIGQLIPRKGVDILLTAIALVKKKKWELKIIGDGKQSDYLKMLTKKLGLEDRVKYKGIVENDEAKRIIAKSDYLILPSRWDGWGAVVNEALNNGVPVLISNRCGAKSIILENETGVVFNCGSIYSLKEKLEMILTESSCIPKKSIKIKKIAENFSGEKVADYLYSIIMYQLYKRGKRPIAPWL